MWNRLSQYWGLPKWKKLLLWEALVALAIARVALICLPFHRIAAWLGSPGTETPLAADPEQVVMATEIGRAVARISRIVPWDGRCLVQALAAMGMLRRRGLEGTVRFGAARDGSGELSAHAWLRFGPCIVTGASGHERFGTFTSMARRHR